jgi:hypothetical protein
MVTIVIPTSDRNLIISRIDRVEAHPGVPTLPTASGPSNLSVV